MEKPWGYYCLNNITGRHFTMSATALIMAKKHDSGWEKTHTIKHPINIDGRKIRTDEEIGTEIETKKK